MQRTRARTGAAVFISLAGTMLTPIALHAQAAASSSAAQDEPSAEIVVTAQRRSERQVDVPISVTTLSTTQLATANVNQLSDTVKLTPGLRFDSLGPAVQPTIRGIGTAITTSGGGPNVAIYVDGYFQPNTYSSDLQLTKLQSIQVLKGPQGTLFGRNTTGGAILVTTADPSTDTAAEFKVQYGRFNSLIAQGYATTGLNDRIAVDLEGVYRRGDGFQHDLSGKQKHIGKYEDYTIRAGIKVDVTDDVSLLVRYIHTENDDPTSQLPNLYVDPGTAGFLNLVSPAGRAIYGTQTSQGRALGYFYASSGTYATAPNDILLDARTSVKANIDSITGTLKADLGFANLTSYTQYRDEQTPYYGDLDATALPFFGIFVGVKDREFSQEFLLNSKPGRRLQWTAGLNYFRYRDAYDPVLASFGGGPLNPFTGSSTTSKSYAGFVDATYQLTDKFFVSAGARYSHDEVVDGFFRAYLFPGGTTYLDVNGNPQHAGPGQQVFAPKYTSDRVTPRVVLRYKPSAQSSIYASYTKGYKAGIINVGGYTTQSVKPESINAYEVGAKYDDRSFSAELAAYYYDYKNLQVSSFQAGAAQIRNAAQSRIYGAEAELRYRVSSAFNVYGGVSYTHARYKSFPNAPFYSYCDPAAVTGALVCPPPPPLGTGFGAIVQTTTNAAHFRMQRAPDVTANLGASYDIDLARGVLTLSGNGYYISKFFFDPSQQFLQKAYALLSLRAQWVDPSKRYTIAVFGDNVTDKRYRTQVLYTTLGTGSVWDSPATYGVSLGVKL